MREELIVASHQPDLLPHTGFWYKMANCDVFDLAVHDQFQLHGYQRRVKMRGHWAMVKLWEKRTYCPITELVVHPDAEQQLWDQIRGRYQGSKLWKSREDMVRHWLAVAFKHELLFQVNHDLILSVKDFLGLDTEIKFAPWQDPDVKAGERVAQRVELLGGTAYLSGTGARAYMHADDLCWERRGIGVRWSEHVPETGDSILTPLFDHEDVLSVVTRERYPVR